jgi:hypothetical protein
MNLKQFLKPDRNKIVIFIILAIILSQIKIYFTCPDCPTFQGLPFPIYTFGGLMLPIRMVGMERNYNLDCIPLFFDLIFWYLFSCFIIWIYDKVKKKEVK